MNPLKDPRLQHAQTLAHALLVGIQERVSNHKKRAGKEESGDHLHAQERRALRLVQLLDEVLGPLDLPRKAVGRALSDDVRDALLPTLSAEAWVRAVNMREAIRVRTAAGWLFTDVDEEDATAFRDMPATIVVRFASEEAAPIIYAATVVEAGVVAAEPYKRSVLALRARVEKPAGAFTGVVPKETVHLFLAANRHPYLHKPVGMYQATPAACGLFTWGDVFDVVDDAVRVIGHAKNVEAIEGVELQLIASTYFSWRALGLGEMERVYGESVVRHFVSDAFNRQRQRRASMGMPLHELRNATDVEKHDFVEASSVDYFTRIYVGFRPLDLGLQP